MMTNTELHKALAPEQFCSGCNHQAIDNAKSCYNLIVHPSAVLAIQHHCAPKCLFNTLQKAKHQVSMAVGDSATHYGSKDIVPMHGLVMEKDHQSGLLFIPQCWTCYDQPT